MHSAEARVVRRAVGPWWLLLITGIAWFIIALVVLRFNVSSVVAVGVLLGVVFLMAGINEFIVASMREGWRWAHILLGVFFILGALWAFITPVNAFWSLAAVLGFLLIFKGTLDIIGSVMSKEVNELWWLGLVAGILEILLGFWASQQFFPARAALILLWVGFLAMFRGFSEIVLAFQVRRLEKETTTT